MNVGIDITSVIYDRGVSRYTSNLLTALASRYDVQLSLYASSLRQAGRLEAYAHALKNTDRKTMKSVEYVIQKYPPTVQNWFWNVFHTNEIKKVFPKVDVFHSWDWLQPPDKDLPLVSTIHDVAILKFPETAHPRISALHHQAWKVLKERDAEIIAVSQATKKDVVELLGFPPSRVHVIYEALPLETVNVSENMTEEEAEEIKGKLQLNRPYILFVGTREPRKNLLRLIEAWSPLAKQVDLIIAGEKGWDDTEKSTLLKSPHLRFLGKVSDKALAVLYGEAELFVYPSLYEGFGLPILEAFYHGTPVVTSETSSMPEVAGNAAELVNPQSVESIRKGIKKILDESREEQQRRMQKMIIRLQLFNWAKVADETVKVYHRAIENHTI
jgi:glycosyltransferase involved in cell wall biosynthesis